MSLAPLLAAPVAIQIHTYAAIAAFALGIVQLVAPKGTLPHRTIGWIWAALMLVIASSSFFIHDIRLWGPFSPIHLLSIVVLVMLPLALYAAHIGRVSAHKKTMIGLFLGALLVAGAFAHMPGRIMHEVMMGAR